MFAKMFFFLTHFGDIHRSLQPDSPRLRLHSRTAYGCRKHGSRKHAETMDRPWENVYAPTRQPTQSAQ